MNRIENELITAMEECAEIQKEISKALRFGLNNHHPDQPDFSNAENIILEYIQLKAVIEKLQADQVLPTYDVYTEKALKMEKLNKMMRYQTVSKEYNCLKEETK